MTYKTADTTSPRRRRRPCTQQPDDLLDTLRPELDAARQLADDLTALVAAGLIAPVDDADELRFAASDPDGDAA